MYKYKYVDTLFDSFISLYISFLIALHLQVNRAPSFGTDQALDYMIKRTMLRDAFKLVNIR